MHPGGCTWVTAIIVTIVRGGGKTRQWRQHADVREMFQWHLELIAPEKKKKSFPKSMLTHDTKKSRQQNKGIGTW